MYCRFCNSKLNIKFVDLVNSPPSNSYLTKDQLVEEEVYYPLHLYICEKCLLVQIAEFKKSNEIFNSEYAYFSSYSTTWLEHCKNYCSMMKQRFGLNSNSFVVEIASNDGYLLQYFKQESIPCLGIEPTESTAKIAIEKGIETMIEFFGKEISIKISKKYQKANLILGNNVLAHVPNINDFVSGVKELLHVNGVCTFEFPHLYNLIRDTQFDTIYHEHFSYFSLKTILDIFEHHCLNIFDVEEISTHGGSLRIYATHIAESNFRSENIASVLMKEQILRIDQLDGYLFFQNKIDEISRSFIEFIISQKKLKKKIIAYGAAAKGNTFLNYCGTKSNYIDFVVDKSPHKIGKFMPGSHIPILEENKIIEHQPDFIIILPWNIREEIMTQLHYVRNWDAKFVVFIPKLEIL